MKNQDVKNIHMHDWVFHFSCFTNTWAAIPRELYQQYWNNFDVEGVYHSSKIDTLIDLVGKLAKDPDFLKKLD